MGTGYRRPLAGTVCLALVLLLSPAAGAAVLEVCGSGCAYSAIQPAIDAARGGDTVLVHDGTYVERIDFLGKAITVRSVGGAAATTIDGGAGGSVVTFTSGEGSEALLKGFTITNGSASSGGGIRCSGSSPRIVGCVITANTAAFAGGGIACDSGASPSLSRCTVSGNSAVLGGGIDCSNSHPSFADCTVSGNSASDSGGGIRCDASSPTIVRCTVSGNSADAGGGICCVNNSAPSIVDCEVTGNSAGYMGGGIYCGNGSSPGISRCRILGNTAESGGGGIVCFNNSAPTVQRCAVSGNTSASDGGGVYCSQSSPSIESCILGGNSAGASRDGGGIYCSLSSPRIVNCAVTGNSASRGGGIACFSSSPVVVNCTLAGNRASGFGGALSSITSSAPAVVNSILWDNGAPSSPGVYLNGGTAAITFSDVQGGWAGTGNLDSPPEFVDGRASTEAPTTAGDYHLGPGSPCIDAGTPDATSYPDLPVEDLGGDPRPGGAGFDMGCDEYTIVANGTFEEGYELVPAPWSGRKLGPKDGRVLSVARGGSASFRLKGSPAAKQLVQSIPLPGTAGDVFDLSCWHKAYRPSAEGGPFAVKVTVLHVDRTRMTFRLRFPRKTHDWQSGLGNFTTVKDYTGLIVSLVYANQRGRAWFDDVRLWLR